LISKTAEEIKKSIGPYIMVATSIGIAFGIIIGALGSFVLCQ